MKSKNTSTDYWFTIEPYVYVGISAQRALLYNTLDATTIETEQKDVIEFLQEILRKDNLGVVLLTDKKYQNQNIKNFISDLRAKYMGDIIDVSLSKSKPIQLLPLFNFQGTENPDVYKKHNIFPNKNALNNLCEICIHIDYSTNTNKLTSFLHSIQKNIVFSIIGNMEDIINCEELLSFFNQRLSLKKIVCSYTDKVILPTVYENKFSYTVLVDFPLNIRQWSHFRQLLLNQLFPFDYIFEVTSIEDCQQVEQLVEQFQIEKYQFKPLYTCQNIRFFEEYIFLTKENILTPLLSIKEIFEHQAVNTYDFGKINIMQNGDVYANVNHPVLGNICTHSINEIVQNEAKKGMSWFHVRNTAPCNGCVYQWLCPSPSDYEIALGRPNLCHVCV